MPIVTTHAEKHHHGILKQKFIYDFGRNRNSAKMQPLPVRQIGQ